MLDRVIAVSLENRVSVLVGALLLLLAGIWAFSRLPIDAVPDVTNNQVQILTQAPALSALEVEQYVTFPIELAVKATPDVVELRSLSRPGLSAVTVVFEESVDIYFARQLLLEGLRTLEGKLPEGVETPELGPVSTGLGEIFRYVVRDTSGRYSAMDLRTIQDWIVRRSLLGIEALAEVNSLGGELKQYQVQVDPDLLARYDLSIRDVFQAAAEASGSAGGGYIETGPEQLAVRAVALATSLEDLRETVVKTTGDGIAITIGDLAEVTTGPALRFGTASQDGTGEVVVGVVMQLKGSNARVTVEGVKERIEEIRPSLPEGVVVEPYYDREQLVDRTIATVATNLIEGALLVIGVLLLLLVSLRAGLVVASVIPLSMCFAGLMMLATGQSGNLMSLGAIDFGLVVDGSLIIVENVLRLLERIRGSEHSSGQIDPDRMKRIVLDGAIEVRKAAQFGEMIIIVVYLPILTLGGIEGKLFVPMALTVSYALVGAFLLSITYVPALLSFAMRSQKTFRHSPVIAWLRKGYRPFLDRALGHPAVVIGSTLALITLAIFGFTRLGAEFIPRLDEGDIAMHLIRLPSISLSESQRLTTETERLLMRFSEVRTVVSHTGRAEISTDPMGFELADIFIMLHPEGDWTTGRSKEELIEEMEHRIAEEVPGVGTQFLQPIEMRTNELIAGARGDVVIRILGEDFGVTGRAAERVADILRETEGGSDIAVEQIEGLPQLVVRPKRDVIARYGLYPSEITRIVETAIGGMKAGEIFEGERRFDLVVLLENETRSNPEALGKLLVTTPAGARLPLEELAEVRIESGPVQISRRMGERFTTVQANVRSGDVAGYVEEVADRVASEVDLPAGYRIEYGGAFENLQQASERLGVVVPIALSLVFALLLRTFGSLRTAVIISLCIPTAVIGGVAALMLRGLPFSISAAVGFIALFGIAVLNGIVLLAAIRAHIRDGLAVREAVRRGADERLRPVVTTAALAAFGFLPMMLATSAGAEVQRPLATVVVGGLVSSTLLTLIVLPVLYDRYGDRVVRERRSGVLRTVSGTLLMFIGFLVGGPEVTAQEGLTKEEFLDRLSRAMHTEALAEAGVAEVEARRRSAEIVPPILVSAVIEDAPVGDLPGTAALRLGAEGRVLWPGSYTTLAEVRRIAVDAATIDAEKQSFQLRQIGLRLWHETVDSRLRAELADSLSIYAREFDRISAARRRAGEIDSLERIRAKLFLTQTIDDSIVAYGALRVAHRRLLTAAGITSERYIVTDTLPSREFGFEDSAAMIADALDADPELRLLRMQLQLADAEGVVVRREHYPAIDLSVGVASIDGRFGYLAGGIGLEFPIGRYGRDPVMEALEHRRETIRFEIERRTQGIRGTLLPLLEELESTRQRYETHATRILPLLEEQRRVALLLYGSGATSYLTVVDALEALAAGSHQHLELVVALRALVDEILLYIKPTVWRN